MRLEFHPAIQHDLSDALDYYRFFFAFYAFFCGYQKLVPAVCLASEAALHGGREPPSAGSPS